ncbi:enoyl-CoA hydratase/isomerase family protein [Rhodococcus sp. MTM3W5.2]|nr:enoyl-CoA hydratase/isomerase family protein [Rhodococcus sp. MTM3W5.2]
MQVDGGVAVVTLDRPDRRNAFTSAMGRALGEAYRTLDEDDSIRAIVLTGAPPPSVRARISPVVPTPSTLQLPSSPPRRSIHRPSICVNR